MCAYKCVPMCVCVCGLVSLCRHCNMLVYFHIYDAAQASCVTHRGGLQFMLVFKCGGVREREKGETKTHRPETKIRGSFNGDYDALN